MKKRYVIPLGVVGLLLVMYLAGPQLERTELNLELPVCGGR